MALVEADRGRLRMQLHLAPPLFARNVEQRPQQRVAHAAHLRGRRGEHDSGGELQADDAYDDEAHADKACKAGRLA